jgi:hypothetical protein
VSVIVPIYHVKILKKGCREVLLKLPIHVSTLRLKRQMLQMVNNH